MSRAKLEDRFESVLSVSDEKELLTEVVRFTQHLGFERVTAMVVLDRYEGEPQFSGACNPPEPYRHIAADMQRARCDPVSQHLKGSSMPLLWDRMDYLAANLMDKWEEQAPFGYASGIALAFHMPRGRHFAFGVDRRGDLPRSGAEASRIVGDIALFASHVQDAAFRILLPSIPDAAGGRSLTVREVECLRWTAGGKTAWEVGRILSISEQTAVRHLNNATKKLDCANKHHAVVKAMRLGLIS